MENGARVEGRTSELVRPAVAAPGWMSVMERGDRLGLLTTVFAFVPVPLPVPVPDPDRRAGWARG